MNLSILYEDDSLVAVDKPAGLMTHPDGKTTEETASDWFAATYPASGEVGEVQKRPDGTTFHRPGVVHRLDRETSGVLVFTKTPEAHAFLKNAFQNREVKKTYLAFIYGVLSEAKGVIDFPIGRSRKDFRLRSAQPKARGMLREAITRYEVLSDNGTHSLVKALPETGRTHQIRVHFKAIHHPVLCDPLYAPNHACDLGFDRLGLHAYRLEVPTPEGGIVTITAPLPGDLVGALDRFPGGKERIASI